MENKEIINKVELLRNAKLIKGCHLYERYKELNNITIGEAAIKEVKEKDYGRYVKNRPVIALLEVIFSIHTDYAKFVEQAIGKLIKKPELQNFDDIKKKIEELSREEFLSYWGYASEDKYEILKKMLYGIDKLRLKYKEAKTDYELLHEWAKNVEITNIKDDVFGRINGVAEATIQHLRMNFGIDTTKPDQQVVKILEREFNIKTNKVKAINYVKTLSEITSYTMIELDQIFVNYGSGYYKPQKRLPQVKEKIPELQQNKIKIEDKLIYRFEAIIEINREYSFQEFYSLMKQNTSSENNVYKLLEYIFEEIKSKKLDDVNNLNFKRRGNKKKASYIFGLNNIVDSRKGKNVFTIWLQNKSIRIHITKYLPFQSGKLYNNVAEMKNDGVGNMIMERYDDIK